VARIESEKRINSNKTNKESTIVGMTKDKIMDGDDKQSLTDRLLRIRLVKAFVIGVCLTFVSLVIIGFNLSTNSGIQINDNINRYFDTCVGEAFTSSTPRISVDERGFPLSYVQTSRVPICENGRAIKTVSSTHYEIGAFFANILFWSAVVLVLMRTYIRRKAIKVTRSA
jgi:hypothetical protein